MPFNSFLFFLFFIIIYLNYLLCTHKWQNRLLLIASYIFYASWDYRFLSLILFITAINYISGNKIARSVKKNHKTLWLSLGVATSLGFLGFFKYFNFFIESFDLFLSSIGISSNKLSLQIILPVGISFYTFQAMSYTIDIYMGRLKPVSRFSDFALFVAFFPQLVAGPIERARNLLPQIQKPRIISEDKFNSGVFLVLYGLFEKVVVADNLSIIVENTYNGNAGSGFTVLLATYAFAFQIFADFDGYSNIAKGLAGMMGFTLIDNFHAPYFSMTPIEFWRRWHISLSRWLRDYLYIPIGGNRFGNLVTFRNIMVTMLLGGLWHGAGWMFVMWGGYHGILLIVYRIFKDDKKRLSVKINGMRSVVSTLLFFHLVCLGWMMFRSENVSQFTDLISKLIFDFEIDLLNNSLILKKLIIFCAVPACHQLFQFQSNDVIPLMKWKTPPRTLTYVFLLYAIVIFGYNDTQSFIYFQF